MAGNSTAKPTMQLVADMNCRAVSRYWLGRRDPHDGKTVHESDKPHGGPPEECRDKDRCGGEDEQATAHCPRKQDTQLCLWLSFR